MGERKGKYGRETREKSKKKKRGAGRGRAKRRGKLEEEVG